VLVTVVLLGKLERHETAVVEVIFCPNAQGTYKEVLEVVIKSPVTGDYIIVQEIIIQGIGYSPKVDGLPAYIDFGNVPLGHSYYTHLYITSPH
jgi:hypothetical protein